MAIQDGEAAGRGERPQRSGSRPSDPRKHAAQLLEQSDRLAKLAHELRREALRLNASLGARTRRKAGSRRPPERSAARAPRATGEHPPVQERRFAPVSDGVDATDGPIDGKSKELEISDGARLLITSMAITGSSREEILVVMQDELGFENADAILESLSL
jgi:hypothetical protein